MIISIISLHAREQWNYKFRDANWLAMVFSYLKRNRNFLALSKIVYVIDRNF